MALSRPQSGVLTATAIIQNGSIKRINFIKWAQALGFTSKEVKELLAIERSSSQACEEAFRLVEFKLGIIERKLKGLIQFKEALESIIQTCDLRKSLLSVGLMNKKSFLETLEVIVSTEAIKREVYTRYSSEKVSKAGISPLYHKFS